MKWDIDWKKLGHPEPKVRKTTYPQQAQVAAPVRTGPESITPPKESPKVETVQRKPHVECESRSEQPKEESSPAVVFISDKPKPASNLRHYEPQNNPNEQGRNGASKMISKNDKLSDTAVGVVHESRKDVKSRNEAKTEKLKGTVGRRRGRDLTSGLELLDTDFILGIVENVDSDEEKDLTLRRIGFNELLRREQLHELDSTALKVYALNEEGHFDQVIQFEAIKELAERTTPKG